MNTLPPTTLYKRHLVPAEISGHGVWLYFRLCLSYRDVEELIAERGVILLHLYPVIASGCVNLTTPLFGPMSLSPCLRL